MVHFYITTTVNKYSWEPLIFFVSVSVLGLSLWIYPSRSKWTSIDVILMKYLFSESTFYNAVNVQKQMSFTSK